MCTGADDDDEMPMDVNIKINLDVDLERQITAAIDSKLLQHLVQILNNHGCSCPS
jgi:ubiquitin-protein ligase E3 C